MKKRRDSIVIDDSRDMYFHPMDDANNFNNPNFQSVADKSLIFQIQGSN